MFDFSEMYPGIKEPKPKTAEDFHNTCQWCRTDPTKSNAYECQCLFDCGRPFCVRADDLAEFHMPEVPRF